MKKFRVTHWYSTVELKHQWTEGVYNFESMEQAKLYAIDHSADHCKIVPLEDDDYLIKEEA